MSEQYATITVAQKEMTSELVRKILETDFSDTSVDYIAKSLKERNDSHVEKGEPVVPIADTLLGQFIQYQAWRNTNTLLFSGETYADDHIGEPACQILRDAGVTYEFYLDNDETNGDETIWSPTEGATTYDICKEGDPTIPLKMMEEALSGGSDREKVERIEKLFSERSSYGRTTPKKIAEQSVSQLSEIDKILAQLDAGAITQVDAFEKIKAVKQKENLMKSNGKKTYLVMIDSEFCDGQAYIDNPEGEFGGDGYVELSNSYPICIGSYRGESAAEAISHAAGDFECDEAILIATEVSESSL